MSNRERLGLLVVQADELKREREALLKEIIEEEKLLQLTEWILDPSDDAVLDSKFDILDGRMSPLSDLIGLDICDIELSPGIDLFFDNYLIIHFVEAAEAPSFIARYGLKTHLKTQEEEAQCSETH